MNTGASRTVAFEDERGGGWSGRIHIDPSRPVAFIRSIEAWNRNPYVVKRSFEERHLALDRTLDLFVQRGADDPDRASDGPPLQVPESSRPSPG
jgi:hypothetical protein